MFIALAAAGATVAVALGIVGIPLVDACAADPRGLAACLHDMAERKFDLPGDARGKAADVPDEVTPAPAALTEEPNTPPVVPASPQLPDVSPPSVAAEPEVDEPLAPAAVVSKDAAPPSATPDTAEAASQGGPLLTPAPDATASDRHDAALAATVEPISPSLEDKVEAQLEAIPEVPTSASVANSKAPLDPSASAAAPVTQAASSVAQAAAPLSASTATEVATTTPSQVDAAPVVERPSPPVPAWIAPGDPPLATKEEADPLAALLASIEAVPPPREPDVAAPIVEPPDIDAIEVDGVESFISGSGPAGALMRLYSDDKLLGESPVQEGRWLVEAADGDIDPTHKLRIEAVDPQTGRRLGETTVTVEFEKPSEPEAAPAAEGGGEPSDKAAPTALSAAPPTPASDPSPAAVEPLAAVPSVSSAPAAADTAPYPPAATAPVAPAVAETKPAAPDVPAASAAPETLASAEAEPKPEQAGPPSPPVPAANDVPLPHHRPVAPEPPAAVGTPPPPSSFETTLPAYRPGKDAPLVELPIPTAPALAAEFHLPAKPSEDAVTVLTLIPFGDPVDGRFTGGKAIIRRGDTLWSIAHRYYGSGIHFRTIFKANRNQISRPSRIFPGQIFTLPLVTEE